jgi:hypothetical protein
MRYKHTQVGYVTGGVLLAALPLIYYAFMVEDGELGAFGYAVLGAFGVLAVVFSSLTVQVTDRELVFYFGPGFWTRRFALHDIISVKVVRNLRSTAGASATRTTAGSTTCPGSGPSSLPSGARGRSALAPTNRRP